MDSQFMRCSIKLTIHFFFISTQTKQLMSVYKDTHTLQRRYIFSQTLTIAFLFREVPVKLLLRLLQVFFLHIHLRQNTQGPMFSTIFQ